MTKIAAYSVARRFVSLASASPLLFVFLRGALVGRNYRLGSSRRARITLHFCGLERTRQHGAYLLLAGVVLNELLRDSPDPGPGPGPGPGP